MTLSSDFSTEETDYPLSCQHLTCVSIKSVFEPSPSLCFSEETCDVERSDHTEFRILSRLLLYFLREKRLTMCRITDSHDSDSNGLGASLPTTTTILAVADGLKARASVGKLGGPLHCFVCGVLGSAVTCSLFVAFREANGVCLKPNKALRYSRVAVTLRNCDYWMCLVSRSYKVNK